MESTHVDSYQMSLLQLQTRAKIPPQVPRKTCHGVTVDKME